MVHICYGNKGNEKGCFKHDLFPGRIPGCPYGINLHPMVSRNRLELIGHDDEDEQIEIDVYIHRVNDASDVNTGNDTNADVERISMRVNVNYGDKHQNCLQFGVHAFADHPDKIFITYLAIRFLFHAQMVKSTQVCCVPGIQR
ncbi:uncharacterized protein [Euphorbia lathyris]|uniref:uncharacterized protein isoform X2 n=1 Tax=Euphorbia lathyris TaxID=212925 RepID=UPI00331350DF